MRAPASDLLLLALAGALLLLGGGMGCEPTLAGVDLRAKSIRVPAPNAPDWYVAFGGKKPPGEGEVQVPYALRPPFGVRARMGVFDERALAASVGADGCIGLRDAASSDEHRLCVGYGGSGVHIAFGSETAECPGVRRAELDLGVDAAGTSLVARYRCTTVGVFTTLDTVPSLWAEGERWNAFVSAAGLAKGAQVGFDDFHVASKDVLFPDPGEPTFLAFDALRSGMEAVYELEDGDPNGAAELLGEARGKLDFVAGHIDDPALQRQLDKAASSLEKLAASPTKFPKSFVKLAAIIASALEALDES
jgi:hypothetical protein